MKSSLTLIHVKNSLLFMTFALNLMMREREDIRFRTLAIFLPYKYSFLQLHQNNQENQKATSLIYIIIMLCT